jgi:hypothetical protein
LAIRGQCEDAAQVLATTVSLADEMQIPRDEGVSQVWMPCEMSYLNS